MPTVQPPRAAVAEVLVRRTLAILGPSDADLDAALVAARAALPPGVELVSEEG
jgi:hypothetical protein